MVPVKYTFNLANKYSQKDNQIVIKMIKIIVMSVTMV